MDPVSGAAAAAGIEQPAILRKLRKQFLADGDDPYRFEVADEVLQQRRRVGRMADRRRHHERHPPAGPQQPGRRHEERRPGCGQAGELHAQAGAEPERALAHLTAERLVANERRIAGRAVEPPPVSRRPRKEVATVDAAAGRPPGRQRRCPGVSFNADAAGVRGDETAVAAGRIEQAVRVRAHGPPHQAPHHVVRRVVGAGLLA